MVNFLGGNLEGLYGDGPVGHPYLFQRNDPAKFLLGADGHDVSRNGDGTAIIGDPRNDSHVLISQMHLAFVHAHNRFVDRVRSEGTPESNVFESAARQLRWHYQMVAVREFLPTLVGADLVRSLLERRPIFYRAANELFIPLEFADAAYHYGHSQIRHSYTLNSATAPAAIFPDLIGFVRVSRDHSVDWTRLFDAESRPPAECAKKIDGRLVGELIALPVALTGEFHVEEFHSLAVCDLERGQAVGLPLGVAVAHRLDETPLSHDEIGAARVGWHGETPLWYYVQREADVRCGGNGLGPAGARMVGELLAGLLNLDPTSVRHAPDDWRPSASLIQRLGYA